LPEREKPRSHRRELWRNRDYMLLWSGQLVSTLGSTMSYVVFPLLVLSLTDSPEQAGIVGALFSIPYVLLSLPAGALIDRWDRKRVMIVSDVIRAAGFAVIPIAMFTETLTVWHLYAVALSEGTFFVFFNIAEVAALPRVVKPEHLPEATSQNMATFAVANMAGPGLGGFLFQSVGRAFPFLVTAVTYTLSAISLVFVRTDFQVERAPGAPERHLWREIKEGMGWLWANRLLRFMAFVTGGVNFVLVGGTLVVIVVARELGVDEAGIGLIFSIGAIGGIAGAALAGTIQRRFGYGQVTLSTLWLLALAFPLFAVAPHVAVLALAWALIDITVPVFSVVQISYRLPLIPDELQGRVNSSYRWLGFGTQPLGSVLAGFLLENAGAVVTVGVFTAILLVVAVATTLNREVRSATRAMPTERDVPTTPH
jgi:MFS family permease